MELPETHRLLLLHTKAQPEPEKRRKLLSNAAAYAPTSTTQTVHSPGIRRLLRFLHLLAEFDKAPWASSAFDVNEAMIRRLTHAHLSIIIGEYYVNEKAALEALCNSPDRCKNLVWITNRQQGKTTTLSKFLAALMVLAPIDGSLACIYSTNYDRAGELLKGAKMYITNMGAKHPLAPAVITNNERSMTLRTVDGYTHAASARPRNPNSCRGDAPKAAFFDEIAFVQEDFWYVSANNP